MIEERAAKDKTGMYEQYASGDSDVEDEGIDGQRKDLIALMDENEVFQINYFRQLQDSIADCLVKSRTFEASVKQQFAELTIMEEDFRQMSYNLAHQSVGESAIKRVQEIRKNQPVELIDVEARRVERNTIKNQIAAKEHYLRKMQQDILVA